MSTLAHATTLPRARPGAGDDRARDLMRHAVLIERSGFRPQVEHNAIVFVQPAHGCFYPNLWIIDLAGVDVVVRADSRAGGVIAMCQGENHHAPHWQDLTREQWFGLNPREVLGILNPCTPEFGAFIRDRFLMRAAQGGAR